MIISRCPALLVFTLFVSLLTLCSSTQADENTPLRAGAAAIDITPKPGVSLDGPISKNGPVTGIHDRLHARALVLDDGTTRLAIVICDLCMIGRDVFDAAKDIVHKKTGLATDRMLMAATHTHAAPRANHIGVGLLDDEYHKLLADGIAAAVIQAEKNLAPAKVGWGSFQKPEFLACRRFLCKPGSVEKNPFGQTGERIKSVSGKSSAVIKPAGPIDPQFSILSVQHIDGSPLAVLGNFSMHYCGGYQRGLVSADYFGHFAQAMQQDLKAGDDHPPFVGIMSNGTSGNTGAIKRDGKKYPPFGWMKASARILADPKQPLPHRWTRIFAQETMHLSTFSKTRTITLQAIRIGELGIAAIPSEVFAETGLEIKKQSPHTATFTIELANGYGGYLPPPQQHTWGGYESWPARSSFLEIQAEPKIRTAVLRLLDEVSK